MADEKKELNWLEKKAMKTFIKRALKKLEKYKQAVLEEKKDRFELEEQIWSYKDDFEMENADGSPLQREDLSNMSIEELTTSFKELLIELQNRI